MNGTTVATPRQTPARTFADAAADEFAKFRASLVGVVDTQQMQIVDKALADLAQIAADAVVDPANAEKYAEESKFVLSTLASEAALVAARADEALRQAIGRAIIRTVARMGFAVLAG